MYISGLSTSAKTVRGCREDGRSALGLEDRRDGLRGRRVCEILRGTIILGSAQRLTILVVFVITRISVKLI